MATDEYYMRLALREAQKGLGRTSPNPCVGAIIVKDDRIIGRGYHKKAGTPHAEINAIRNATEDVAGATIYVTLEPCSHTGKTPPCCEALVKAGFIRVVIGMQDPNPLVNGRGVAFLQRHGVVVVCGVHEEPCRRLNDWFIKFMRTRRPWTIMKAGISLDGRLSYRVGTQGWITGEASLRATHQLRDRVDAILVGRGTVAIDDPSLTTRLANRTGKDAIRVIVDSQLSLPLACKVYQQESQAPTWICCGERASQKKKDQLIDLGIRILEFSQDSNGINCVQLVDKLGKEGIGSLLVEGGGRMHGSFLRAELYDQAYLFMAPRFAGSDGEPLLSGIGITGRERSPWLEPVRYRRLGEDILVVGNLVYPQNG